MPYLTSNLSYNCYILNFLSHYYFERYASHSEQVLGGLLPDLLKNADKKYSFQLHKVENKLPQGVKSEALSLGWKHHVEVDKLFHSSDFFYHHTHELRKTIEGNIDNLPVRASFLAHISLELLLDHKLIADELLNVSRLYEHLENVDKILLSKYLNAFELIDLDKFFNFYGKFVASKYIFDYSKVDNLPYALFNICKRIWNFTPSTEQKIVLGEQLDKYQKEKLSDYEDIFIYISGHLD